MRVKQADLEAAYAAALKFVETITDEEVNSMSPRTFAALRALADTLPTHKQI